MSAQISVPVRRLVEFILRSGSIDQRFGSIDRMTEGSRLHKKLQKAGGSGYMSEVPLSYAVDCGAYTLLVEGRADGIISDSSGNVTIEEIKTTSLPVGSLEADFCGMHRAQAMCYGYMFAAQNPVRSICVRLTYYQRETGDIKRFERVHCIDELSLFFHSLVGRYRKWTDSLQQWISMRDASISRLAFPFSSYRKGQRELAVSVYKTVAGNRRLFCQAPTGIGKTISVLFPAVKAFSDGNTDKIFYLTPRTTARKSAEDTVTLMRGFGLRLRTVTLTAKDSICFLEHRICSPEACTYANGHYDRINGALFEMLQREEFFTKDTIGRYANAFQVCPFEMALDLTLWSDCIISDYNYVFDPRVYLKRFFAEPGGNYVFLVDEAHNLTDRAREMFSASLIKSSFLAAYKQLDKKTPLRKSVFMINKAMVTLRKGCMERHIIKNKQYDTVFHSLLLSFTAEFEQWMRSQANRLPDEKLLSLYFDVLSFLKISEYYSECYITLAECSKRDFSLRLFCIDPSGLLDDIMKKGRSSILFSATLSPMDYFFSILGGNNSSARLILSSPFPRENLCLMIADGISTKFKDREESKYTVAGYIAAATEERTGNYIVYFPSYAYMHMVYDIFKVRHPGPETAVQGKSMSEDEREAFLLRFQADNPKTLIGFCVMGGIYSESIDLKGDRLIGTVIVGVGLPQINPEQDVIREYFDHKNRMGYAYAYRYPGMNKVLQSAGRVIRSDTDRGMVVLIDERFASSAYRHLIPDHWKGYRRVNNADELRSEARAFWAGLRL